MKNLSNIFVVIVMAFTAAVANAQAQTADSLITITEEDMAIAVGARMNDECSKVEIAKDSIVTVKQHGGFYIPTAVTIGLHDFSNNDGVGDTGSKTTIGGDLGVGYRLVRKNWAIAIFGEVFGGVNSSYHVENREVKAHAHFGALAGIENSHGVINFGGGIKYSYDNAVSENANMTPWRGNKHKLEPFVRLTTKLFSLGNVKNVPVGNKIIPVRVQREVKLFVEGSYNLTNTIDKTWDDADALQKGYKPELKDNNFTVRVGLQIYFR